MSEIRFDNRVAVITGAGGGLGKTYALELGRRGARVVVNDLGGAADGSGASPVADEVVKEIEAAGGRAAANRDSVATVEGGQSIFQTALDAFGACDDCDDLDDTVYPGATEICEGSVDENCDRTIDKDCGGTCVATGDPCTTSTECCSLRRHPQKSTCK